MAVVSELSISRRFERRLVRFQARLEANTGDRWIPLLATVALAGLMIQASWARIESLEAMPSLAGYSQSAWLLSEGLMPKASLFGTNVHLLELHWSFIMYPLGALATIFPAAKTLMLVQAVALSLTVVPLWLLARQVANLRVGAAGALIAAYALHPATHTLGTLDFHPEALAVPAIVAMAYFGSTKRWSWYWIAIVFALAVRADLGLAIGLWGFVVLGARERTVAVWTLGVGLVWSLGLLLVVHPVVADASSPRSPFATDTASLGDLVLSSARDPFGRFGDLIDRQNVLLAVTLLAPLIFLPLLSLRMLAPALPLTALYMIAGGPIETTTAERSAMLLAFLMISATFALNRLGKMGVDRVFLDGRVLSTLSAAAILLFVSSSPISPYEQPWNWSERDRVDESVLAALDQLPPDTVIRSSPSALVHLSSRPWLFSIDGDREPSAAQAGFPGFTRAVLIVDREIPERSEQQRHDFDRGMRTQGFSILFEDAGTGVTLYSRR